MRCLRDIAKWMSHIRYPGPLKKGDRIAVTAPSSGLEPGHYARLEIVVGHLRAQGFEVIEGGCLKSRNKHVSAPKNERAAEFQKFWFDDSISAIMPPWGGELLIEILPLLDFDRIRNTTPKWLSGYSDVSTLHFALTLKTGIATLHGSNLMDLAPSQTDPLTTGLMKAFTLSPRDRWVQHSSEKHQKKWVDFVTQPSAPLNLTEPTHWRSLHGSSDAQFQGRIIGGCVDTIARLVGTPYGDLPRFRDSFGEGMVFYFENCELPPCELARTLWNLRLAGWFDKLNGILIGRSNGPNPNPNPNPTAPESMSYEEVLHSVLGDLPCPIIIDADIGHRPPQFNIINGSLAEVHLENGKGTLIQTLKG